MAPLPHRIRRQRWRIQTRSSGEAFAARQRVRDALADALQPALERAFDEAAPGDEVVHLSRLEVRVCLSGPDALSEQLPELLYRQVREQLGRAPGGLSVDAGPGAHSTAGARRWAADGRHGHLEAPRVESGGSRGTSDEVGAWSPYRLRSHYLESGSLPWPLAGLERSTVLARLRLESDEALRHVRERSTAASALDVGAVAFYFRLLQLLPVEQWGLVAAGALVGARGAEVARAIDALAGASGAALTRDARLGLAAVLLAVGCGGPREASARELIPLLVRAVGDSRGRTAEALTSSLPEAAGSLFRRWLVSESAPRPGGSGPAAIHVFPRREQAPGVRTASPEARAMEAARGATGAVASGPDAEPFLLPVSHAGLLLLHPYLPRFFESTGVKEAKKAELPVDRLPRAAALLHLLAVGDEEVHELELDFIKLLLGLTPDAPLPVSSGLLGPSDDEEAGALLKAVIEHWKALKSTSVQGLRASFLRRRGYVREQEQGLRLQVEPAAFDVLLGAIPWGIGTVKLPWMRRPIFTDWPTH
ncbi:hypothetical protein LY474_08005 [Myxococcus stipitatus]|uniref:contractile injection system tape measure protein n=1 Tax=Myxococcus stipitatus TaxID=83455 RepID=UPI001EEDA380|nr:contractile injection system tape measure protein [Myxococcus stipitatus]MCE9667754.1 hypothetical protein [Myxococcus stipitatus]